VKRKQRFQPEPKLGWSPAKDCLYREFRDRFIGECIVSIILATLAAMLTMWIVRG